MNLTEKQLIRAIYSSWDFQQALSALTFLLEDCDFEAKYNKVDLRRFRCYESTMIIAISRPLEQTRGETTIGLRALGIRNSDDEKILLNHISNLRNKVIAHSLEEEMHFRIETFDVDGINIPNFNFSEHLLMTYEELQRTEVLLQKLIRAIGKFIFDLAQREPELLKKYNVPKSFKIE